MMNGMRPIGARGAFSPAVIIQRMMDALDRKPYGLIALAARLFPAAVFWQSGQTKVAGWHKAANRVASPITSRSGNRCSLIADR